ncbi:hypothetical protein EES43_08140 [Streptomyces sp. ADI96-02]|nr:hypothetical protein EES43_08140 [Streptomyces sp. ADI96-02]
MTPHRDGGLAGFCSLEWDGHGPGRSRGGLTTRIHLPVDASFHVLAAVITAGQRGDAPVFGQVMDGIRVPRIGGHRVVRPEAEPLSVQPVSRNRWCMAIPSSRPPWICRMT